MIETAQLQRIIEGALLAAGKPVPVEKLEELFAEGDKPEREQFEEALNGLAEACADRGFELKKVSSGYRFQVRQELSEWVSRLWEEKPQRYSRAVLETLSIIAYRQPITRGDIEKIRGVAVSTQIVQTLLEHEWVRVVGHRDVPGRPAMYATTKQFLDYFNLASLEELPPLAEIRDLESINRELSLDENKPVGRIIEFPEPEAEANNPAEDAEEAEAAAIGTRPISEILSEVDSKLGINIEEQDDGNSSESWRSDEAAAGAADNNAAAAAGATEIIGDADAVSDAETTSDADALSESDSDADTSSEPDNDAEEPKTPGA